MLLLTLLQQTILVGESLRNETDPYIEKYHPTCLLGVSDEVVNDKTRIGKIQGKFNNYIKSNLKMNLYYEHI